jgi:hypothetical protein
MQIIEILKERYLKLEIAKNATETKKENNLKIAYYIAGTPIL